MQTVEIKCDACDADLTYTGNCQGYYLVVGSESKSRVGGVMTMMAVYPPVDRTHHFCGLACMDKWRAASKAPIRRNESEATATVRSVTELRWKPVPDGVAPTVRKVSEANQIWTGTRWIALDGQRGSELFEAAREAETVLEKF